MKVIKNILLVSSILVLISGCSQYNLEPKYSDNKTKLVIDEGLDFKIKHINYDRYPIRTGRGNFFNNSKSILLDNKICSSVKYKLMTAGERSYISNNYEMDLRELIHRRNDGSSCTVTKINNLKFISCLVKQKSAKKKYSRDVKSISSSTINAFGFDRVESMRMSSGCFDYIYEHYKNKAEMDKIEIETYKF
jgi:hypothetical protein